MELRVEMNRQLTERREMVFVEKRRKILYWLVSSVGPFHGILFKMI